MMLEENQRTLISMSELVFFLNRDLKELKFENENLIVQVNAKNNLLESWKKLIEQLKLDNKELENKNLQLCALNSTLKIEDCRLYSNIPNRQNESAKLVEETFEIFKDNVNSPNHYKLEGLNCETIDVVKARLGKEGFKFFCVGNILKYILRAEKKNGLEDYKKARKYLDWLIEREEK